MTVEKADKIRQDYGEFLEHSNGPLMLLFMNEIPESLLPHPKSDIEEALNICIDLLQSEDNKEMVETFKGAKAYLMFYAPVEQALKSASKRFVDPKFLKVYTKIA